MPYSINHEVRTFYVDEGSGLPIIMLHGAWASHRVWRSQMRAFSNRYRMIAIDFRGHGDSDKPKAGYGLSDMKGDITSLMDHLGLEKAVIMGSSMGGVVAQSLCLDYPKRVMSLVLVGTLPMASWSEASFKERASKQPAERVLFWFTPESRKEHKDLAIEDANKVSSNYRENVVKDFGNYDFRPRLHEISVPTLIIVGEEDGTTPKEKSELLRNGIKGSQMNVIPGSGHLVMLEQGDDFDKILAEFLRKKGM